MKLHILIIILALSCSIFAQKTVSELKPAHAAALERFLSKHSNYGFLSERVIQAEYLKDLSKQFRKKLVPYYQVADFNGDGVQDFAMVLSREGEPKESGATAEEFAYNYPLVIVIFNGNKRGGYTPVFVKEIETPLYCFLNIDNRGKKPELYFGVFETDADTMIFTPAGKGYIIEFPEEP